MHVAVAARHLDRTGIQDMNAYLLGREEPNPLQASQDMLFLLLGLERGLGLDRRNEVLLI